jgi:hypothetical protein
MCTLAPAAFADPAAVPDPALTPGVVATSDAHTICVRGYDRAQRVWHDKADTLRKYGIPMSRAAEFEDDGLIPICLGGDNADPRNHWPMKWDEAVTKDELEGYACRQVCIHGASVIWWQNGFRTDWRTLYRQVMGRNP